MTLERYLIVLAIFALVLGTLLIIFRQQPPLTKQECVEHIQQQLAEPRFTEI